MRAWEPALLQKDPFRAEAAPMPPARVGGPPTNPGSRLQRNTNKNPSSLDPEALFPVLAIFPA